MDLVTEEGRLVDWAVRARGVDKLEETRLLLELKEFKESLSVTPPAARSFVNETIPKPLSLSRRLSFLVDSVLPDEALSVLTQHYTQNNRVANEILENVNRCAVREANGRLADGQVMQLALARNAIASTVRSHGNREAEALRLIGTRPQVYRKAALLESFFRRSQQPNEAEYELLRSATQMSKRRLEKWFARKNKELASFLIFKGLSNIAHAEMTKNEVEEEPSSYYANGQEIEDFDSDFDYDDVDPQFADQFTQG